MTAFTPVEAGIAKRAALAGETVDVDADVLKQLLPDRCQFQACRAELQCTYLQQVFVNKHTQFAGEMIVTNTRFSQCRFARAGSNPYRAGPECNAHQGFQQFRHIVVGQAKVTMPSLRLDFNQARVEQLGKMAADGLLGYTCHFGKLGGGERLPRH